ncbi:MAG: hypothetical protein IK135_02340 [Bacteroidales bacterium]|nr:hypothetical protein [Bacteroidales bacterium]
MMRAIQIDKEVLVMRWDKVDGKVCNLQSKSFPVGVYMNLLKGKRIMNNKT